MNTPICEYCTHFRRHYVLDGQSCTAVECGHCVFPRVKSRKPNTPACTHFAQASSPQPLPDRERTVHYLTTEVLEYILSLELPPKIEGTEK